MKCPICEKKNDELIYNDGTVIAYFDAKPYNKGHIVVATKNHYVIMEEVPNKILSKMFYLSSLLSSIMYAALKPGGTNILINNGIYAGQDINHFSINIIPRYEKDDLKLTWKPKKPNPNKLKALAEDIKMNFIIGDDPLMIRKFEDKVPKEKKENKKECKKKEKNEIEKYRNIKDGKVKIVEEDYEIQGLRRIP